jgi:hypothetical protein
MTCRFAITSFSGLRSAWADNWFDATAKAEQFAAGGNLPSTILCTEGPQKGYRWTKWSGSEACLQSGCERVR